MRGVWIEQTKLFYLSQSKELLVLGRHSHITYINVCICALLQCYSIHMYTYINLLNVSVICISSECKSISPTITLELVLFLFYYYLWCSFFFSYSSAFRTSYIFRCCHNTMLNIKRQDGLSCNYAKNKIDRLRRMWFVRATTTTEKETEKARKMRTNHMNRDEMLQESTNWVHKMSFVHVKPDSLILFWLNVQKFHSAHWRELVQFSFRLFCFFHLVFREYFVQQHSSERQAPCIWQCDSHAFSERNEHWPGLTVCCLCRMRKEWNI